MFIVETAVLFLQFSDPLSIPSHDTAQCIAELIIHASGLAISYSIHPDIIYSSPFPKLNYFLTKHQPYY
jgi:hypothetical protein